LRNTTWPGRFDVLRMAPILIADGAHTPYSMQQLCASLRDYFPGRRVHFIIGTLRDKDSYGIIAAAASLAATLTFADMHTRRATRADRLLDLWRQAADSPHRADQEATEASDLSAALQRVHAFAMPDDVICVTGSLHLVAEAERLVELPAANGV
jgi:dihydrofolate synthase/folylpolyglutamate synthase